MAAPQAPPPVPPIPQAKVKATFETLRQNELEGELRKVRVEHIDQLSPQQIQQVLREIRPSDVELALRVLQASMPELVAAVSPEQLDAVLSHTQVDALEGAVGKVVNLDYTRPESYQPFIVDTRRQHAIMQHEKPVVLEPDD
eukprot:TRINITY_DN7651_c0_g2_i1.p1 TRINITY_DN7651_c0_g2~~TRINITY_DN7651_c0_g2_i1.p1  ORF type:complete len:142 (-),score=20.47 TRINITY_DN7651_c0_g2_i1:50-475(-)